MLMGPRTCKFTKTGQRDKRQKPKPIADTGISKDKLANVWRAERAALSPARYRVVIVITYVIWFQSRCRYNHRRLQKYKDLKQVK